MAFRHNLLGLSGVVCATWLAGWSAASAADLGYVPPAPSGWQFSFTPYAWTINVNGDVTARGHTAEVNEDFFQIVDKSDSILAWMSYFEARKGRVSFFTDFVWMDLGFPGRFQAKGSPFKRFPNAVVNVAGKVQLDYESTIIQSGVAYEVAHWQRGAGSFTALDVLGSARYWNQDLSLSLGLSGSLTADLQRLGLKFKRSRSVAVARANDLEWVDPVVGARIRHQIAPGKHLNLEADVGGFGAGSEFSWQVVGRYGFDVNCLGQPLHMVLGYRALSVDYSESGRFGKDGLDAVQHGPVMGVTFNW
ncbi:MAG TPA: hypothetical protein VLB11_03380 [Methyloceanibacter sp.]|nr:hypothetical protein [Methyloceanibacter sp.]